MTRGELRARVVEFGKVRGKPFIAESDTVGLNAFINECGGDFSERTYCIFSPRVPLALQVGVSAYSLRPITGGVKMIHPTNVRIAAVTLRDFLDRPGPISREEFYAADYPTPVNALPERWCWTAPDTITFNTPAAAVGTSNTIDGYTRMPELDADEDDVPILEPWHHCLAVYIAARLHEPKSAGETLAVMRELSAKAVADMAGLVAQVQETNPGIVPPALRWMAAGTDQQAGA